jgi:hypothetical protein
MGFEDLDVIVLRQGRGRTAHQCEQEIHGERHIGRDEHRLSLAETAEQPCRAASRPVIPTTRGIPAFSTAARFSGSASGSVKSIATSAFASACAGLP